MYDILWNLHYFCGLNHTKSILTDLFPNYTEEKQSIHKFFRSYVYPAMFNMVVMALYNIVDRIFIGQGAGALAICGLALTLPCVSLLSTVGTLTGVPRPSLNRWTPELYLLGFHKQPFPGLLYPGKCHCIEYPIIYDSDRLLPVSSGLYPGYLRRKRANYPLCP